MWRAMHVSYQNNNTSSQYNNFWVDSFMLQRFLLYEVESMEKLLELITNH